MATQLDAGRTPFFISGIVELVRCASAGIVGERSWVRPSSSDGCTSRRSCVMNGRLASIVGPVDLTPGISVRASARSGGNAALSALNAGVAAASVFGSSATACWSATFWRANAPAVVLKSVIRLCRFCGCASIAPATVPILSIQFERSCGWIPSASWATIAEYS